jgi:hypothetical protein
MGEEVPVSSVIIYNGDVPPRLSNSLVLLKDWHGKTLKSYRIGDATGKAVFEFNKNSEVDEKCNELLQQFHRVDEELSIQGKWQGGSVTGVCRGWGTNKVRSSVHYNLGRYGRSLNEVHSCCIVPLYPVYIPPVNVSYCEQYYAQSTRKERKCDY